jgi:two-component system KDP operon response regulator KdpE
MTQAMHRILIVEDDAGIRNVVRSVLETQKYRVAQAETAARADVEARSNKPDLIVVDLGLPDRDGVEVIRGVRSWSTVPIIVLSARTMDDQKIAALDAGADDYVTKPFSAAELLARVRAALRRSVQKTDQPEKLHVGGIELDLTRRHAFGPKGEIHLTPLEYRVLENLSHADGMIVRQDQLIEAVWGPNRPKDTRNLRGCIANLRAKLEPDPKRPRYLLTEAGIGYRLRTEEIVAAQGRAAEPAPDTVTDS